MAETIEEVERSKKTQYRASIHPFFVTMEKYGHKLHEHTKERLENHSPFWSFIKIFYHKILKENDCKKVDEDIKRMADAYIVEQKGFMFKEQVRRISVKDVADIFGVPMQGLMFDVSAHMSKPESNFIINTYFKRGNKVTKTMIDNALELAICAKTQRPKDVVSLMTMSLFATLFFCSSGSTLCWKLVDTCTDDMTLKNFNWAQMILDYLHQGLSKKKGDKDVAFSGCLPLMMYWLGNKTSVGGLISKNQFYTPTFACWSLPEMHKSLLKVTDDELEDMIAECVVPNVLEQQAANEEAAESEDIHLEEIETPSFGEWRNVSTEEIRNEGERAQERMRKLIGSLEETTAQPNSTQEECNKAQELLQKLTAENEKLKGKNDEFWELLTKTHENYSLEAKKVEILKKKVLTKWKIYKDVEKERDRLKQKNLEHLEEINKLKEKVKKLNRKFKERDLLSSQIEMEEESDGDDEDGDGGKGDGDDDDEADYVDGVKSPSTKKRRVKRKAGRVYKQKIRRSVEKGTVCKEPVNEKEPENEEEEPDHEEEEQVNERANPKKTVKRTSMVDRIKGKKRKTAAHDEEFEYPMGRTRRSKRTHN